ncbi:MAG: DUF420 domain-containing protein [Candidatus Kariarchaeaceae archaeon]
MVISSASPLAISGFVAIAIGLILLLSAMYFVKKRDLVTHKRLMIGAVVFNSLFLVLYVIRWSTEGETAFNGPSTVHDFIYLPILIIHITTALVSIYLVSKQLWLGIFKSETQDDGTPYFKGIYRKMHRKNGRVAFYVWGTSFIGGILIFSLLYVAY